MLSQTAEYALRAALHIAEHGADRAVPVGEIAEALDVPRNYLSKTLHQLSRAGVVTSTFGPGGGYHLAAPPDQLTLEAVVAPFDAAGERHCLLGRSACLDANPCSAHVHWKGISEQIHRFFVDTTLAMLLRDEVESPVLTTTSSRARRVPRVPRHR